MIKLDVDEIVEVNHETNGVEISFKDGTTQRYDGAELPEVLAILNHWTPPTA
jgi:hypothetical protein